MDRATIQALLAINERFYRDHAADFSRTRRRPWPGWRLVLDEVKRRWGNDPPPRPAVLDVGCGNGRLLEVLETELEGYDYLGVDRSESLLSDARARPLERGRVELTLGDLLADDLDVTLGDRAFDLIVVFGVLHHLPARARRVQLLQTLAGHVTERGVMATAFWDFMSSPRFETSRAPWSAVSIDERGLEDGDYLLKWGNGAGAKLRYCHFASEQERNAVTAELPLAPFARFSSDGGEGNLNHYVLLG